MRKTFSHRRLHAALTGFATILVLTMASSPATGSAADTPWVPESFDGGGYGSTAQSAIYAAIGDAENTASGYGLYTCELVGEPQVFPQPPGSLRRFTAQVKLRCTA